MKKIFTLELDGLTMIPSEEAAQMIGGGGGGGSNGTQPSPTIPPINGWTVTPFGSVNTMEGEGTLGIGLSKGNSKMDMSLDSNKGNFPNAGFGFTQGFNHFYGGEKVNTDGSFSLVGGYKNGNFKVEHSENLKNGEYTGSKTSGSVTVGATTITGSITTDKHGAPTGFGMGITVDINK